MPSALNVSVRVIPVTDTVTVFVPGFGPNVRVLSARPLLSVVTLVALSVPPPLLTENVTWTPGKGLSDWSRTSTINGFSSAAPGCPSWSLPEIISNLLGIRMPSAVNVSFS